MQYSARVLGHGIFTRENIILDQIELPAFSQSAQDEIERIWAAELVLNPHLISGPLLVGQKLVVEGNDRIRLTCGLSNYKNFMGTTRQGQIPDEQRHRALGIMAMIQTADRCFILGVRSPKIDYGLLRHVVPAGRLRPGQDPYSGILSEFREELGLGEEHITSLQCLGVVSDLTWGRLNYEFVFLAKTGLTSREVFEFALTAKSAAEHCQLEAFPVHTLEDVLRFDPQGFVPTGWAGLKLCASYHFFSDFDWEPVNQTYEEHMGRRLKMLVK